ncbi:MAG TPA: malate synthase G, partial [Devosia sp.]|nr:malate synthase G [Devosia sp.]
MSYTILSGLQVDLKLVNFIEEQALPGSGVDSVQFWDGLANLVNEVAPRNRELLAVREEIQGKIDDWHAENGAVGDDPAGYRAFLRSIGYIVETPEDFIVEPGEMDPEISSICGPQLVVPVSNARYALNAANARWGSLFDALYGTDAISQKGDLVPGKAHNKKRAAEVFKRAAIYLDQAFALKDASHRDVV